MVYRVLSDGIDIFGADTDSALLSPSLELELNSAGSFNFTLPPDHPSYDDISLMQSEIEVYEDDTLIFFGRPAEISIDWYKQKKVVCEGALAYLNDAAIRPHKFEGELISNVFRYIIAQYNAQVAQDKQINIGSITITDRYVYTEFDYDICMSVLMNTCVNSTGGYIFIRKETNGMYIDWLADVPYASDQPVQFAVNMLDLAQDTKAEDICSVVLPVGGQVDGVNITIASVNGGSDILEDATAISKYGRILKIQSWNDIIDPQALKDKATAWLAEQQEDDITIETNAAELHYLDGSVGPYRLGQLVTVVSGPHGIDKEFPILKLSMSLDSGVKKVTLGTPPRKELTELSGITNSGGGSSGGSGGGGGGGTTGITDVLVNGSSVVSDHVARISVPTDTVTSAQLNTAVATLQSNFQDGVDAVYNACVAKGSTPASQSLSDVVQGVMDIPGISYSPHSFCRTKYTDLGFTLTNWIFRYTDNFELVFKHKASPGARGNWPGIMSTVTVGNNYAPLMLQYNFYAGRKVMNIGYNATWAGDANMSYDSPFDYDNFYKLTLENGTFTLKKGLTINGINIVAFTKAFTVGPDTDTDTIKLLKHCSTTQATMDVAIFGLKVYRGGVLIHNYVPNSSGLHDTVDNVTFQYDVTGCSYGNVYEWDIPSTPLPPDEETIIT